MQLERQYTFKSCCRAQRLAMRSSQVYTMGDSPTRRDGSLVPACGHGFATARRTRWRPGPRLVTWSDSESGQVRGAASGAGRGATGPPDWRPAHPGALANRLTGFRQAAAAVRARFQTGRDGTAATGGVRGTNGFRMRSFKHVPGCSLLQSTLYLTAATGGVRGTPESPMRTRIRLNSRPGAPGGRAPGAGFGHWLVATWSPPVTESVGTPVQARIWLNARQRLGASLVPPGSGTQGRWPGVAAWSPPVTESVGTPMQHGRLGENLRRKLA